MLTVIGSSLYAQNVRFVRSGIITYKKTVNMYAIIQRGINKENETLLKPGNNDKWDLETGKYVSV